jgi:hypothetical protein
VELLQLGKSGIRVATYLIELPSRKLLQKKLHQTICSATQTANNKKKIRDVLKTKNG